MIVSEKIDASNTFQITLSHFFSEEKVRQITEGFDILNIENFEEGKFPRKLFRVVLKKKYVP